MIRRTAFLLLSGSLTFSLAGCGAVGNDSEASSSGSASVSTVASSSAPVSPSEGSKGETGTDAVGTVITLLGPEEAVELSEDPVALVVEVASDGQPQAGVEVTFLVTSGPAEYPDGFEVATTDEQGVAVSQHLVVTGEGQVVVEAATATTAQPVAIEVRR